MVCKPVVRAWPWGLGFVLVSDWVDSGFFDKDKSRLAQHHDVVTTEKNALVELPRTWSHAELLGHSPPRVT